MAGADTFTDATVIAAEGARVALLTCKECGAAILLDPRDDEDRPKQHAEWHKRTQPEVTE